MLHLAVRARKPAIVKLLLEKGAAVDAVEDSSGKTPLFQAASDGSLEIARLLVAGGANVNSRDRDGSTPLHSAAAGGQVEMVRFLLGKKADRSARDAKGRGPADVVDGDTPAGAQIRNLLGPKGSDAGR
jgi:ankyrin repeat protein